MSSKIKFNFTPAPDEIVQDERLGYIHALVYGMIFRYCQMHKSFCEAGIAAIAKRLCMSERTVRRKVKDLCEAGYVKDLTPDIRNVPHRYVPTDKLNIEQTVTYDHSVDISEAKSGMTESPTGMTESPTKNNDRYDTESDRGMTESPMKRVLKETKEKNKGVSINRNAIPIGHKELYGKQVGWQPETDSDLEIAIVLKANGKTVDLSILESGEIKKAVRLNKVFYRNGGDEYMPVTQSADGKPKLTPIEKAMKDKIIDMTGAADALSEAKRIVAMKECSQYTQALVDEGYTPADLDRFEAWTRTAGCWLSKKGVRLSVGVFNSVWQDFVASQSPKKAAPASSDVSPVRQQQMDNYIAKMKALGL